MEAKNIFVLDHDNKENIPPFLMSKKPGPNVGKPNCALVKKVKGIRRPLRDVTILYRGAELRGLDSRAQSPVSASVFSSSKKRKLVEDDDEEQRTCSKILRRQYR